MALSKKQARARAAREIKMAKSGKQWILKRWDEDLRMFLNSHPMPYHAARIYVTAARAHRALELEGLESEIAGDAVEAVFPREGKGGRSLDQILVRARKWLQGRTQSNPWLAELETRTHSLRGAGRSRSRARKSLEAAWKEHTQRLPGSHPFPVQDMDSYFIRPGWGMRDGMRLHPPHEPKRIYHFFPVTPGSKKYAFFDPTGTIKGDPRSMTKKQARRFAGLMRGKARFHKSWAKAQEASEAVRKGWKSNPGDASALAAYLDEDRPPGQGPFNLDCYSDPEDLLAIARAIGSGIRPVAEARILFPRRPKGYVEATLNLRGYAVNKAVAMQCRERGDIEGARVYELMAEKIYRDLPDYAKW